MQGSSRQSPTTTPFKAQPCPCHSALSRPVSTVCLREIYCQSRQRRGGSVLSKQTRIMASSAAGSGEPANANSVSAAELRSPLGNQAPTVVSEGVLDLLLQSAELLLVLGIVGTHGSMLLTQWQQHQQQQQHQAEALHSRSPHKHEVLKVCLFIQGRACCAHLPPCAGLLWADRVMRMGCHQQFAYPPASCRAKFPPACIPAICRSCAWELSLHGCHQFQVPCSRLAHTWRWRLLCC